jgi:hypothetical protein
MVGKIASQDGGSAAPPNACGFKGYGKGNYGTEVPVPCLVDSDGQAVAAARVPEARSPTPQEISQWM